MASPENPKNLTSEPQNPPESVVIRIPVGVNLVGYPAFLVIRGDEVKTEKLDPTKPENQ